MSIQSLNLFSKPEYVFRPRQILRRLLWPHQRRHSVYAEAVLPWGLKMRFHPQEVIGACIWKLGLYDLCVSETIWRLVEPGDFVLDVGANIGHMTSIMAVRVGAKGTVSSFEPHPEVFGELVENTKFWESVPGLGRVVTHNLALSNQCGTAMLGVATDFAQNRGTASLEAASPGQDRQFHTVETKRLSDLISPDQAIGLLKLDVEGHELAVLEGGVDLFRRKQIRDIVFEEHDPHPTPVTTFLEEHGYTLLRLTKQFRGLGVTPIGEKVEEVSYEPPSYLATVEPQRAIQLLRTKGWAVFGAKTS
jgi:FkbM family methyltransferase